MNTQTLRCLNDIAMSNSAATLALQSHDGTVRSMHCEPTLTMPGVDSSGRYVIVRDTWLSAKCGRAMFRRVDLETIVGIQPVGGEVVH